MGHIPRILQVLKFSKATLLRTKCAANFPLSKTLCEVIENCPLQIILNEASSPPEKHFHNFHKFR